MTNDDQKSPVTSDDDNHKRDDYEDAHAHADSQSVEESMSNHSAGVCFMINQEHDVRDQGVQLTGHPTSTVVQRTSTC